MKTNRWRAQGKQVLQNDQHFADAVGEVEAMMIVNAMSALDHRAQGGMIGRLVYYSGSSPDQPTVGNVIRDAVRRRRPMLNFNECRVMRQSDEMVCACGLRWHVSDPEPPRCVHRRC